MYNKYNAFELIWNLPPTNTGKNCLPLNLSLVPKSLGITDIAYSTPYFGVCLKLSKIKSLK